MIQGRGMGWIAGIAPLAILAGLVLSQATAAGDELPSPIVGTTEGHPGQAGSPVEPGEASASESAAFDDILDLDLDQLAKVNVVIPAFNETVSSVTRTDSTVAKSPAAVFVITQEMIRRSGVTSIPEALRMAPGLNVAKTDANKWAITARGFNSRFAGNLLVLFDGRSVYNQVSNGVYWEVIDYPLQDIERIEVIRGPGAVMWGENAVNGVINIITKSAQDTQGTMVSTGVGDVDEAINSVRYGGLLESGGAYRIYVRQTDRDSNFRASGAHDDWRQGHVGFRIDKPLDEEVNEMFTMTGDIFAGTFGEMGFAADPNPPFSVPYFNDTKMTGGNLLARWSRQDEQAQQFLQVFYDRLNRNDHNINFAFDTFDLEYQYRCQWMPRHHLTFGANVRQVLSNFNPHDTFTVDVLPNSERFGRYGVTLQDEFEVIEDRATLYVGSKLAHNSFTGFQVQPGVRGLVMIDDKSAGWASISRAVRLPSYADRGISFRAYVPEVPGFAEINGNPGIDAASLMAYELGYRRQQTEWFSWDVTGFYNVYNDMTSIESTGFIPGGPPFFLPTFATELGNSLDAVSYGVEYSATLEMTDNWRLRGWYSLLDIFASGVGDQVTAEGSSPRNQAYLMSSWNLGRKWELDVMGRYVDNLPASGVSSYVSMDTRLGFRPNDCWELSLVGQNLLDGQHLEFSENIATISTEVPRGIYFQAVWRH